MWLWSRLCVGPTVAYLENRMKPRSPCTFEKTAHVSFGNKSPSDRGICFRVRYRVSTQSKTALTNQLWASSHCVVFETVASIFGCQCMLPLRGPSFCASTMDLLNAPSLPWTGACVEHPRIHQHVLPRARICVRMLHVSILWDNAQRNRHRVWQTVLCSNPRLSCRRLFINLKFICIDGGA